MGLFETTAATGLYRLKKGSAVVHELLAMQAGIDLLNDRIDRLERAPFADQMDRLQLEQACLRYGFDVSDKCRDAQLRRAVKALSAPLGCSLRSMELFFEEMGCNIQLEERPERCIAVKGAIGGLFQDCGTLYRLLVKLLPQDIKIAEELGVLTWNMFDAFDFTVSDYDAQDFTWTWFETNGHLLDEHMERTGY